MPKPQRLLRWLRPQFSLRFLFCVVTLLAVGISAGMIWWQWPYDKEQIVGREAWLYARRDYKSKRRPGAAAAKPISPKFRQVSRVYNNLDGEEVMHGPLSIWDMQGRRLRLEHWKNGQRHGKFTDWTPQGEVIAEGEYVEGKKHGVWRRRLFPSTPSFVSTELYAHGELKKRTENNRGMTIETLFKDGKRDGPTHGAYPGGGKRFVGAWRKDKEHGRWKWWSADGELTRDVEFHDGRLVRPDGTLSPAIVVQNFAGLPSAQAIMAELEERTQLEFIDTPLQDAMRFLKDFHKVEIRLDPVNLEKAGISPNAPVTIDTREITFRAALALMLDTFPQRDLVLVIRNEILLVTAGENQLHWRDPTGVSALLADRDSPWPHKLAEPIQFEFIETPLRDVCDFLSGCHKFRIALDLSEFHSVDRIQNRPITMNLHGISLAAALTTMLDENDLAVEARGLELAIVPAEAEKKPKSEILNPKQIQSTKNEMTQTPNPNP